MESAEGRLRRLGRPWRIGFVFGWAETLCVCDVVDLDYTSASHHTSPETREVRDLHVEVLTADEVDEVFV
ncbi:MAG TPA: hypothetical protein VJ827_00790 [Rubrobacter sp.]|nr:hypothetical protein [Rubrobacter sp.]